MNTLTCMGVLAHPLRPQSGPVAEYIAETLRARGIQTWVYTTWDDEKVQQDLHTADMIVAIGGDGAMLRAARVSAPFGVPVLGVNMGQLGFLTEISEPDQWEFNLERILQGDYWIEQRMMLLASVLRDEETILQDEALNDIVISGNIVSHMIQVQTYINDGWATTYNADALIVATPTGSTAYALACGGPILPPELHNILIVPAAPHLSMERPIVLAEGATVEIVASTNNKHEIVLVKDGLVLCKLDKSDRVRIRASGHFAQFVRLRDRNYFYRSLLDRLEPRIPHDMSPPENEKPL